jgi:hypothetical protein
MALYKRWKFTVLLVALICLLVVHPLIYGNEAFLALVYDLLLAVVFLTAILVLFQRRKSRVMATLLGFPTLASAFANQFWPVATPVYVIVFFQLVSFMFLGYTVVTILMTILVDAEVSADSINGALCGYLLIGAAFGHLYCFVESVRPGSFLVQEHFGLLALEEGRRHSLLTYFSLVTLTTLGYGDITPHSPPARSLACVEAIIGQFYVAVIIAGLVALRVSAAIREHGSDRTVSPTNRASPDDPLTFHGRPP